MLPASFNSKHNCLEAGWASGFSVKVAQNIVVIRNLSRYGARPIQSAGAFLLTARQYGEVVLPDAIPAEHGPGFWQKISFGRKRRVWRTFCRHGTNFNKHHACRGTSFIGAAKLSPVTKLVAGTGAVSRYKLSRSQNFVKVQDFNSGQMSVSGCKNHY